MTRVTREQTGVLTVEEHGVDADLRSEGGVGLGQPAAYIAQPGGVEGELLALGFSLDLGVAVRRVCGSTARVRQVCSERGKSSVLTAGLLLAADGRIRRPERRPRIVGQPEAGVGLGADPDRLHHLAPVVPAGVVLAASIQPRRHPATRGDDAEALVMGQGTGRRGVGRTRMQRLAGRRV